MNARVKHIPQFRALILWVPTMMLVAETEDALLGAALLFIASCAADGSIKSSLVERLAKALRLHDIRVHFAPTRHRADARGQSLFIDVHAQVNTESLGSLIAEGDHLPELPGGVHMQQWKGRLGRPERLHCQVQQHRAVLANGVHQDRPLKARGGLTQNLNALCFEFVKMGEFGCHRNGEV